MSAARKAHRAKTVHGAAGRTRRQVRERTPEMAASLPTDVRYGQVFHPDGSVTELRTLPTGRRQLRLLLAARTVLVVRPSADRMPRSQRRALEVTARHAAALEVRNAKRRAVQKAARQAKAAKKAAKAAKGGA